MLIWSSLLQAQHLFISIISGFSCLLSTILLPGLSDTKMNLILFLQIKQPIISVKNNNKNKQKAYSKADLRSQPCSKMFNGSLFLDININSSAWILRPSKIWLHLPYSILNMLYLLAQIIKLHIPY